MNVQKTITVLEVIHNLAQQELFSLAHRNLKVCFQSAFFVHVKHRLWELLIREFYKAYMSSYTTNETRGLSLRCATCVMELHVRVIFFFDIQFLQLHVTV